MVIVFTLVSGQVSQAKSLFDESDYRAPVEDFKARRVGDSVTVIIFENAEARAQANRDDSGSVSVNAALGKTNRTEIGNLAVDLDQSNSESNTRKGQIRAQISAVVQEISNNGMLRITGEQVIVIDGKEQLISLSGWIRPYDIAPNNSVISSRLAEARIDYVGYESEQGGRGFIGRILDFVRNFL